MTTKPLVSIIIPTYNRAHLIMETLESVKKQTYSNWECLVIDDGSTDNTKPLLLEYTKKDSRFQYQKRPQNRLQGGNAARNYGFECSKGDYIQWFDSDDIMMPNHVELKLLELQKSQADLVIAKSNYNDMTSHKHDYQFKASQINFESYAIGTMAWKTVDFMVKRQLVQDIAFNEKLRAGQEYNFICKLLLKTNSIVFIDEYLTKRREHDDSIGAIRRANPQRNFERTFQVYWLTYLDVHKHAQNYKFDRFSMLKCIEAYLSSKQQIKLPNNFKSEVNKVFGVRSIYFYLAVNSQNIFGRYHRFYKILKNSSQ